MASNMKTGNSRFLVRTVVGGAALLGGTAVLVAATGQTSTPAPAGMVPRIAPASNAPAAAPAAAPHPAQPLPPPAPAAVPLPLPPMVGGPNMLSAGELRGISKPSNQGELYFNGPGVIKSVAIKLGDTVKAGQIVAVQDDREEQAVLAEKEKAVFTAQLQILAADADLADKKVDQKRAEDLYRDDLAQGKSNTEVDKARVGVKIGEIAVKYRTAEYEAAKLAVDTIKVKIEQKKLVCPLDGVVAKVDIHPGEGTDINRSTNILVVRNDPLWVDVNIPSDKVLQLRQKGVKQLQVRYLDSNDWQFADVINFQALANPSANVTPVRLQVANPSLREAGLQMNVKLPDDAVANADPAGK